MPNPFDGIYEKLERADENIRNLDDEISRFFNEGEYAVIPQDNSEVRLEALAYHTNRVIPLRFSVLAGEIIHHLRSCLDHIAWHFSSTDYRSGKGHHYIEFPVFDARPHTKHELARYERKVHGIENSAVRGLIEELQPYNSANLVGFPLLIIHRMNIFDKHRELVTCVSSGTAHIHVDTVRRYMKEKGVDLATAFAQLPMEIKLHSKVTPQVSFRNVGGRKVQAVIPLLMQLSNYVRSVVGRFDELLKY